MKALALAFLALALPAAAIAQTLPQSTQDRQAIANLEYQANLPGTDPATKAHIAQQISQLQYRINTRPLVEPMPTFGPSWNMQPGVPSTLPTLNTQQTLPTTPTIYGSCDADKAVLAYLQEEVSSPATSTQERSYDFARIGDLQRAIAKAHC